MRQPVPETQILPAGGAPLRFALGSATGARSNVWSVFGSKNFDDVYVGARDMLPVAKLSLHESGLWRRAYIKELAVKILPPDEDRVLNRWEPPTPFADGWLHAVSIIIPCSSVQKSPEPLKKKSKKGGSVSFYEPDPGSHQVCFDVLIKSADAVPIKIENIHAEVGRIKLPGGGCAGVVATEFTAVDDRAEAEVESLENVPQLHDRECWRRRISRISKAGRSNMGIEGRRRTCNHRPRRFSIEALRCKGVARRCQAKVDTDSRFVQARMRRWRASYGPEVAIAKGKRDNEDNIQGSN